MKQDYHLYTAEDHLVWETLYTRQMERINKYASKAVIQGMEVCGFEAKRIPNFDEVNERLEKATGWKIYVVPGLIDKKPFFEHLHRKEFCATTWLRKMSQLDYLEEPDVFHDVFGQVPLLSDPVFADYMQAYGAGGLRSMQFGSLARLSRLYWYTVEFGLIRDGGGLKLYGAGIVSSAAESHFALDSESPNRLGFDLQRVLRTQYRIDDFQQVYFVIDSFQHLLDVTLNTDFSPIYQLLDGMSELRPADVLADDMVFSRGTQAHVLTS